MQANRLGLGLRPPLPSYGQGPSLGALAQQQQMSFVAPQGQSRHATLFIGSISGGITDSFLNQLLAVGAVLSILIMILTMISGMWSCQGFQTSYHASK